MMHNASNTLDVLTEAEIAQLMEKIEAGNKAEEFSQEKDCVTALRDQLDDTIKEFVELHDSEALNAILTELYVAISHVEAAIERIEREARLQNI